MIKPQHLGDLNACTKHKQQNVPTEKPPAHSSKQKRKII